MNVRWCFEVASPPAVTANERARAYRPKFQYPHVADPAERRDPRRGPTWPLGLYVPPVRAARGLEALGQEGALDAVKRVLGLPRVHQHCEFHMGEAGQTLGVRRWVVVAWWYGGWVVGAGWVVGSASRACCCGRGGDRHLVLWCRQLRPRDPHPNSPFDRRPPKRRIVLHALRPPTTDMWSHRWRASSRVTPIEVRSLPLW